MTNAVSLIWTMTCLSQLTLAATRRLEGWADSTLEALSIVGDDCIETNGLGATMVRAEGMERAGLWSKG